MIEHFITYASGIGSIAIIIAAMLRVAIGYMVFDDTPAWLAGLILAGLSISLIVALAAVVVSLSGIT